MKKIRALVACAVVSLVVALPATSQAVELTREQSLAASAGLGDFARQNLAGFTVASLDNGIPVVIKRSTANRILTVQVFLLGHVSLTPVEKAGTEAVMLQMLTRGSARYPYAEVQRLEYEDSARLVPSYGSFDYTSLNLMTIDTYFDPMFDLFADSFLHPAWTESEFPRVLNDFRLRKQRSENDPDSRAMQLLRERFFAGHPYQAYWEGEGDSLDGISLQDVKAYYQRTVTAGRLFIVAVGNFDPPTLLARFNSSFGALERQGFSRPPVASFEGRVASDLMVEGYPASEGLAYVRGNFALPPVDSADWPALQVASSLLDDLLFEIVRTRNGAAYGASSSLHGFAAPWGDITIYKTSVPGKVKPMIDQAIAVLASGSSMGGKVSASAAGKSGIGSAAVDAAGSFVPLAEALPFYKAQFLTRFYSGEQTNASVAAQIASSIVYHGDYRDYLFLIDRINAVTAEDVVRVVKRYLVGAPFIWIALGDPALIKDVKADDFVKAAPGGG